MIWGQFESDLSRLIQPRYCNIAGRTFSKSLSKDRKLNCNIWVAGDFNLPKMDWDHMCPSPDCKHPSFYRQITEVLNDSNLTQTVSIPTRESNIIDLFFTTNPTLVKRVSILPGISDHDIVQIQVNILFQKPRSISLYKKAKLGWDEAGTRSLPSGHA